MLFRSPLPLSDPLAAGAPAAPPLAPLVLKLASLCTAGLPPAAGGGGSGLSVAALSIFAAAIMFATGAAFSCAGDCDSPAGSALTCGSISIGSADVFSILTCASATPGLSAAFDAPRIAALRADGARRGGIVGVREDIGYGGVYKKGIKRSLSSC